MQFRAKRLPRYITYIDKPVFAQIVQNLGDSTFETSRVKHYAYEDTSAISVYKDNSCIVILCTGCMHLLFSRKV